MRSALPHVRPTEKRIGESGYFLLDWGAGGRLYQSDLTRLLATGKIPPKLERLYRLVLKAQTAAIKAIRPGQVPTTSITRRVRSLKMPDLGKTSRMGSVTESDWRYTNHRGWCGNKQVLKAGMVVTVEPGIYLPGWGGVRIEDDVLVTQRGHEVLTTVPKQWDDVCR